MKKIISAILCLALICVAFVSCGNNETPEEGSAAYGFSGEKELAACGAVDTTAADITITGDVSAVKIGVILVGDDTEGYTKAHMDGIKAAEQIAARFAPAPVTE